MGRKTVNVHDVINSLNSQLRRTDGFTSREQRQGVILAIEEILFASSNYGGFRYLTNEELPFTVEPGVRYENGNILPDDQRFIRTDDTRRQYFIKG